jgi:hypothetical protein
VTAPSERLPQILPGIYGARDAVLDGRPLRALLGILGGELDALADAVSGLWDDHFVERASPEALPLLAELLGARLYTADPRVQRAVVARSVAWRRRKGTLATLEEILSLTSLWDVEIDEAFRSLLATQDLNALVPWRGRTALLGDPIALADPLSRRSPTDQPDVQPNVQPVGAAAGGAPLIGVAPGETIDEALRRLGRADAGRAAASPRTLDLLGFARPDVALIRASRLVAIELEEVTPRALRPLPNGWLGLRVDPLDRDGPLVWDKPLVSPDLQAGLTARHEPAAAPPPADRTAAQLLTPTALAEDADAAERAGALTVSVEGIPLVGPPELPQLRGPLPTAPVGPAPALRFADEQRPSPDDAWTLDLLAARDDADIPLLTATATPGATSDVTATAAASQILNGATVALRLTRAGGRGRQRAADGTWTTFDPGPPQGEPRSPAAAIVVGAGAAATTFIARAEQHVATGQLRLARFQLPGGTWQAVDLAGDPPLDTPGISAISDGGSLLLVAKDPTGRLGVWRVTDVGGSPTAARIDAGGPRLPPARLEPSLALFGGRLYVHGGDLGGAPTGDLWSIPLGGGPWRPHAVRHRQERVGASLLPALGGLVLLGGQSVEGQLDTTVFRCDPTAPSMVWRPVAALPFDAGLPGVVVPIAAAVGIEALVWADRSQPVHVRLDPDAGTWTAGTVETAGCNPPAPGEALDVAGTLLVVGPPPLPPSDVIFSMGDAGQLAFLPEIDLFVGESVRFHVANDGATFADERPGQPLPLHTRPGGLLHASLLSQASAPRRFSVPERLARRPFKLRQRSLGPWDSLVAEALRLDEEGVVALDPRLGRVVLGDVAPRGRVTVSARIGRGAAIGAGAMPVDRAPPPLWRDPDLAVPTPPDLPTRRDLPALPRPVDAWVAPRRAGGVLAAGGVARPIVATPEDGTALAAGSPVLGVLASPRLPPVLLKSGVDGGVSLFAADFGAVPVVDADERDLSLAVQPRFGGDDATQVWLAGLWLAGRVELVLARGQADLRWCNLGAPGETGLWLPGAGHQDAVARRSIPDAEVEVRLYGCMVGVLDVPPWVRVIAAGCTFDAGGRAAPAIRAAGARVRLRHCTVLGATQAGQLEASSCAFAGAVTVDRPDLGWLRHCLLPPGGAPPALHRSLIHGVSFASVAATDPTYLVLAPNNGAAALTAAEAGGVPGAHGERTDHERELYGRTDDNLPIGLVPFHVDRTTTDLFRMGRT